MKSQYIIRVELYGQPAYLPYAQLHSAMEKLGCSRQIRANNGVVYDLPPAMYYAESPFTATRVVDLVKPTVDGIWNANAVLAIDYKSSAWNGLKPT